MFAGKVWLVHALFHITGPGWGKRIHPLATVTAG